MISTVFQISEARDNLTWQARREFFNWKALLYTFVTCKNHYEGIAVYRYSKLTVGR